MTTAGNSTVTLETGAFATNAFQTNHFERFSFGCEFGFYLTISAILINLI